MSRFRQRVATLACTSLVAISCGASDNSATTGPIDTAPSSSVTDPPPEPVSSSIAPATVSTTADRLDEAVEITWIGGSEVQLEDRSLVDAVSALLPELGDRSFELVGDTSIGPTPSVIATAVRAAADRNVDGLIVSLNPAWVTWTGHEDCLGVTPHHEFYTCVLEPTSAAATAALRLEIAALIDNIVDTGLPAYLYVMGHSAESLVHPELADLLANAETTFDDLDPGLERIRYIGHYLTRDIGELHEGVEFNDMVHPSALGIEVLAAHLAREFEAFFPSVIG